MVWTGCAYKDDADWVKQCTMMKTDGGPRQKDAQESLGEIVKGLMKSLRLWQMDAHEKDQQRIRIKEKTS